MKNTTKIIIALLIAGVALMGFGTGTAGASTSNGGLVTTNTEGSCVVTTPLSLLTVSNDNFYPVYITVTLGKERRTALIEPDGQHTFEFPNVTAPQTATIQVDLYDGGPGTYSFEARVDPGICK